MPKLNKRRLHLRRLKEATITHSDSQSSLKSISHASSEFGSSRLGKIDAVDDMTFDVSIDDIKDLFNICKDLANNKYISTLLFMCLRHFGIRWRDCDSFMGDIGGLGARTCQKWIDIFVAGDFDIFENENRGGKHGNYFYDVFPDLECEGKTFAIERCSKKTADFNAAELAKFIDHRFYELSNREKPPQSGFVRSVESCRLDLRRWGGRFKENSQRPYFEGHDRPDVVEHREKFVNHFINQREYCYQVSGGKKPSWISPKVETPVIVICKFYTE